MCSHCEKPFRDPVILPCSHNTCLNCAESLISYAEVTRTGSENGHGIEGAGECNEEERPPEGRVAMVSCPVCGKSICIGSRDVLSFPRNRILVKLVSRAFGTAEVVCEMCDTVPASPGTVSCEQCEITYCKRCCRMYHPRRGPSRLARARLSVERWQSGEAGRYKVQRSQGGEHQHVLCQVQDDRVLLVRRQRQASEARREGARRDVQGTEGAFRSISDSFRSISVRIRLITFRIAFDLDRSQIDLIHSCELQSLYFLAGARHLVF